MRAQCSGGPRKSGALACGAALVVLTLSCGWLRPAGPAASRDDPTPELPRVDPPPIRALPAPEPQLGLLPPGLQDMRVSASNESLQALHVTLRPHPAAAQSSQQVFDEVIRPLLSALGFQGGADAFQFPPDGVRQPAMNLAGAAQLAEVQATAAPAARGAQASAALDVLAGRSAPNEQVNSELRRAEGTTADQFKADFERPEFLYPFAQVVEGVPIEHTALVASRTDGQTVSSVSGTLLHFYVTTNRKPSKGDDPVSFGQRALRSMPGLENTQPVLQGDAPALVLLPYGNAANGSAALRYAWRMVLGVELSGLPVSFLAWVDADTARMLKLQPLTAAVEAAGNTWRRDPGTGVALRRSFEVDGGGMYRLQLDKVSDRLDFGADKNPGNDLQIASGAGGSANFDQPPINDRSGAECEATGNAGFSQVNFFATLQANRQHAIYNGVFEPFPIAPWKPSIGGALCTAMSTMYFGACGGYSDGSCPNHFVTGDDRLVYLNYAHDGSVVAHELAHEAVQRLTTRRPPNWCGLGTCPVSVGWFDLHDLADVWADHVENTNCFAGWVAKNVGGTDHSRNCIGPTPADAAPGPRHSELGQLPRRHELDLTVQPLEPRDHFPEHRQFTGDYADMQIAAAVLWQLREGMRSRYIVTGSIVYFARLLRAIKASGGMTTTPARTDLGIYTYLQDLEVQLTQQWASYGTGGDPTANKVLAAFARGGLFVIPAVCIDGKPGTGNTRFCPNGEDGADAAVDLGDNDTSDDVLVDDVRHVESDFLRLGGPAPTFRVWTGSRFVFDPAGSARSFRGTAPCNSQFRVEVSIDPAFPAAATVASAWRPVDVDVQEFDGSECFGTWTPNEAEWQQLQLGGASSTLYYRASTMDDAGNRKRISTQPGNGLWDVPPASARLTLDGSSDPPPQLIGSVDPDTAPARRVPLAQASPL